MSNTYFIHSKKQTKYKLYLNRYSEIMQGRSTVQRNLRRFFRVAANQGPIAFPGASLQDVIDEWRFHRGYTTVIIINGKRKPVFRRSNLIDIQRNLRLNEEYLDEDHSDSSIVLMWRRSTGPIRLEMYNRQGRHVKPNGAMFPFIHLLEGIDLHKLGIYNTLQTHPVHNLRLYWTIIKEVITSIDDYNVPYLKKKLGYNKKWSATRWRRKLDNINIEVFKENTLINMVTNRVYNPWGRSKEECKDLDNEQKRNWKDNRRELVGYALLADWEVHERKCPIDSVALARQNVPNHFRDYIEGLDNQWQFVIAFQSCFTEAAWVKFMNNMKMHDINDVCCLEQAFITAGVPNDKIEIYRNLYRNQDVKRIHQSDLEKICNKMNIRLYCWRVKQAHEVGEIDKQEPLYKQKAIKKRGDKLWWGPNDETVPIYTICKLADHYFADIDIPCTKFAIQNYDKLFCDCKKCIGVRGGVNRHNKPWTEVTFKAKKADKNGHYQMRHDSTRFNIPAHIFVYWLIYSPNRESRLKEITRNTVGVYETIYSQKVPIWHRLQDTTDKNHAEAQKEETMSTNEPNTNTIVVYFDFETVTKTISGVHEPFLVCWWVRERWEINLQNKETVHVPATKGFKRYLHGRKDHRKDRYKFVVEFLDVLADKFSDSKKVNKDGKKVKNRIILKAHNLRYDLGFLMRYLVDMNSLIPKGTRVKSFQASYTHSTKKKCKVDILFRDTYSFIALPLREFGQFVDINIEKDVMPYEAFTWETLEYRNIPVKLALECKSLAGKTEDINQFMANINKIQGCRYESWNDDDLMIIDEQWKDNNGQILDKYFGEIFFDHHLYALYYCKIDVEVTAKGDSQFRRNMMEVTNLDIDLLISAPQLAHEYGQQQQVFQGVMKFSGLPREYMQTAIEGGRVMVRNNEKHIVKYDPNHSRRVVSYSTENDDSKEEEKDTELKDNNDEDDEMLCDWMEEWTPRETMDWNKRVYTYNGQEYKFINRGENNGKRKPIDIKEVKPFLEWCFVARAPMDMENLAHILAFSHRSVNMNRHCERYKDLMRCLKRKCRQIYRKMIKERIIEALGKFKRDKYWYRVYNCILQDFDACSLYPSAIDALCKEVGGFLCGPAFAINNCLYPSFNNMELESGKKITLPKVIVDHIYGYAKPKDYITKQELREKEGYIVTIMIHHVGIHRDFPLITRKNKEGIRMYENTPGLMTVDRIKLEDLVEFQNISFSIVRGYYWDDGRNPNVGNMIVKLYEKRMEYKQKGSPLQQCCKNVKNSFYGRLIQKPHKDRWRFAMNKKELEEWESFHANSIQYSTQLHGCNKYIIKLSQGINEHFSMPHVGAEILSMSKRLMNRVMCLAEDNGIIIFYTDTDSMHIDGKQVDKLAKIYRHKYGKEIIGTWLGQFHVDFTRKIKALGGVKCDKDKDPYSDHAVFLHKKSYIDHLVLEKDGKKYEQYHIRMKGIPTKLIKENNEIVDIFGNISPVKDPMELYTMMHGNANAEFDLAKTCMFEMKPNYTVANRASFKRTVKFNSTKHVHTNANKDAIIYECNKYNRACEIPDEIEFYDEDNDKEEVYSDSELEDSDDDNKYEDIAITETESDDEDIDMEHDSDDDVLLDMPVKTKGWDKEEAD